jgi:predicted transcriptional regulator
MRLVRKNLMDLVTLSGIRKELLFYLNEGPHSLSDIRDRFDITSPEVSPRIKELIEHDLVNFENRKYHMTPMGKTIVKNFLPFVDTINVFDQYGEWWKEHDLSCVPIEMLFRIGELKNFFIIEDDANDADRTRIEMLNILNNSTSLVGITCTFNDTYPEMFLNLAKNNVQTKIIITDKIYETLEKKYLEQLKEFSSINNSGIYVSKEEIKISQIVTDKCLFLSLCYKNGRFDLQSNLVSNDPSSVKWGNDLFNLYLDNSIKLI